MRPEPRTNLQFVFDCVYDALRNISHDTGYKTNGYVVIPSRDPRAGRSMPKYADDYEDKKAAVSLRFENKTRDTTKSLGAQTWWNVTYDFWVLRTLSTDDDSSEVTVEDLAFETQDDLERLFKRDAGLVAAASRLVGESQPGTYATAVPHIVDHKLRGIYSAQVETWPDVQLLARATFSYCERG